MVLTYISLIISDRENLFTCLLSVCMSSEKISVQIISLFLNQVVWDFCLLSCMSFLYILDINPYLINDLKILSAIW